MRATPCCCPPPCYPVFIAGSLLGGAKPWYYPLTKEHGFLPYVKDIPEDVARKAKYMIVSLPANPVGSVGTPELYAELVAFAKKYDILIIHDNAYSDIIFDGAVGNSFFNTPGAMDVGVEFFSLSKSFNVTGARISFLCGPQGRGSRLKKLRGQIDFGMFLPVQKAAIAALTGPLDMVKTQCGLYQQRRDALCGGLRSIGWNVPDSHGSMFVWAPIPAKYAKSMDFCLELVEKSGVLCTPGSSFGPLGEGYVRFALTPAARAHCRGGAVHQGKRHSGLIYTKPAKAGRPKSSRFLSAHQPQRPDHSYDTQAVCFIHSRCSCLFCPASKAADAPADRCADCRAAYTPHRSRPHSQWHESLHNLFGMHPDCCMYPAITTAASCHCLHGYTTPQTQKPQWY